MMEKPSDVSKEHMFAGWKRQQDNEVLTVDMRGCDSGATRIISHQQLPLALLRNDSETSDARIPVGMLQCIDQK